MASTCCLATQSTIVWCQEALPDWLPAKFATSVCAPALFFPASTSLIRWLFEPPHPSEGVMTQKTLVVGWREAKPCAQAIFALRTGDTHGLRPDQKRWASRPLLGANSECLCREKEKAILTIIVVVDGPRQEARARKWATGSIDSVDVHVASTPRALLSLLQAKGGALGLSYSLPPGLECQHLPKDGPTTELEEQDTSKQSCSPTSPVLAQRWQGGAIMCTTPPPLPGAAPSIPMSMPR